MDMLAERAAAQEAAASEYAKPDLFGGHDADELAHAAAVAEFDDAGDLGEQRVVLADADVLAGLDTWCRAGER